ncbi:hypothetical protein HK405_004893 [Cladochytrium tenue]|nr:hypothetical protein HK405_004893 [Cladochytrium tenue]
MPRGPAGPEAVPPGSRAYAHAPTAIVLGDQRAYGGPSQFRTSALPLAQPGLVTPFADAARASAPAAAIPAAAGDGWLHLTALDDACAQGRPPQPSSPQPAGRPSARGAAGSTGGDDGGGPRLALSAVFSPAASALGGEDRLASVSSGVFVDPGPGARVAAVQGRNNLALPAWSHTTAIAEPTATVAVPPWAARPAGVPTLTAAHAAAINSVRGLDAVHFPADRRRFGAPAASASHTAFAPCLDQCTAPPLVRAPGDRRAAPPATTTAVADVGPAVALGVARSAVSLSSEATHAFAPIDREAVRVLASRPAAGAARPPARPAGLAALLGRSDTAFAATTTGVHAATRPAAVPADIALQHHLLGLAAPMLSSLPQQDGDPRAAGLPTMANVTHRGKSSVAFGDHGDPDPDPASALMPRRGGGALHAAAAAVAPADCFRKVRDYERAGGVRNVVAPDPGTGRFPATADDGAAIASHLAAAAAGVASALPQPPAPDAQPKMSRRAIESFLSSVPSGDVRAAFATTPASDGIGGGSTSRAAFRPPPSTARPPQPCPPPPPAVDLRDGVTRADVLPCSAAAAGFSDPGAAARHAAGEERRAAAAAASARRLVPPWESGAAAFLAAPTKLTSTAADSYGPLVGARRPVRAVGPTPAPRKHLFPIRSATGELDVAI